MIFKKKKKKSAIQLQEGNLGIKKGKVMTNWNPQKHTRTDRILHLSPSLTLMASLVCRRSWYLHPWEVQALGPGLGEIEGGAPQEPEEPQALLMTQSEPEDETQLYENNDNNSNNTAPVVLQQPLECNGHCFTTSFLNSLKLLLWPTLTLNYIRREFWKHSSNI